MRPLTIIIGLTALLIAIAAESFSVYGIYKTFGYSVAIAAAILGVGKIVTTVFLHKFWKHLTKIKWYFAAVVIALMVFTSAGIVGYLSSAYQSTAIQLDQMSLKKEIYESEYERIKTDRERLLIEKERFQTTMQTELDGIVVKEKSRYYDSKVRGQVLKRYQPFITEKDSIISSLNNKMTVAQDSVSSMKLAMINVGKDVGPIMNIADIFETSINNVVKWFIYIIIPIFDPFALALIIAWSWLHERDKHSDKTEITEKDVVLPSLLKAEYEPSQTEITEEPPVEEIMEQKEPEIVEDSAAKTDETVNPKSQRIISQHENRSKYL